MPMARQDVSQNVAVIDECKCHFALHVQQAHLSLLQSVKCNDHYLLFLCVTRDMLTVRPLCVLVNICSTLDSGVVNLFPAILMLTSKMVK